MVSLMLARNNFTGRIPPVLYDASLLTYLDISGNRWALRVCVLCVCVWGGGGGGGGSW